jgi:predicted nucleotidyltransferase
MKRDQALSILLRHREELIARGVESLSLVGSVAREESDAGSDVDLVVRLAEGARGLAHFRQLDELGQRLGEILGCRVDLVEEAAVSQRMLREIQKDRVLAF